MKKTNENGKRSFAMRAKRFFKHYFGLLVLAFACAALFTIVIFYAFA